MRHMMFLRVFGGCLGFLLGAAGLWNLLVDRDPHQSDWILPILLVAGWWAMTPAMHHDDR